MRSDFFNGDGIVLIFAERNRVYALTSKNRIITSCFCLITIAQFALGLRAVVYAAKAGCESEWSNTPHNSYLLPVSATPLLPIPLPAYIECIFRGEFATGIGFTSIALAYGMERLLSFKFLRSSRGATISNCGGKTS